MKETAKRIVFIATILYVVDAALSGGLARGADGLDEARIKYVAGLLSKEPKGFGAPVTDRSAWKKPAQNSSFGDVIAEAEKLLQEPIPDQPDDLYLD